MDINERFALWEKKYKPHGEHEELLYIIAKDAVAALSSPHPEAREEDIETIRKAMEDARQELEEYCAEYNGENYNSPQLNNAIDLLSRLAAQKDEGLRKAVERVVPYVIATLAVNNSVAVPGNREWRGVHAGRADSSIGQLEGLLAALREPDGRKGE